MRFVDLFAGLGGFHLALKRLGHTCVFASEIDRDLQKLYSKNFGIEPAGDIRTIRVEDIPEHDILCAGFPCQPFSKAGTQQGFDHPEWGDLFAHVLRILEHHKTQYLLLENVPNLERHAQGRTWLTIKTELEEKYGYRVLYKRLSPHRFGIPQVRDRMFIIGSKDPLSSFVWPRESHHPNLSITSALDINPGDARKISPQVQNCLDTWQDFLERYPLDQELPTFPIWSMEFGATYPFEDTTPYAIGTMGLRDYKGSHGSSLADVPDDQVLSCLPSYARSPQEHFPAWKVQFIRQNRALYKEHKAWIDEWLPSILAFPPSLQKLEWNCKGQPRNIWSYIIQFRASGVRVKRPTTSPSLVAMTTTQVPIVAWERRYMTPRECARLQSMYDLPNLPEVPTRAYNALGNAVNADLVEKIAKALFSTEEYQAENRGDEEFSSITISVQDRVGEPEAEVVQAVFA